MRDARRDSGRLLLVGHPDDAPWHLTAHLEMLARYRNLPHLTPTLLEPDGLSEVTSADTVLFVSELAAPERVLDGLQDARRRGSSIFGLVAEDDELAGVAAECVSLGRDPLPLGGLVVGDFEVAAHLLGAAAARPARRALWRPRGT